VLGTKNLRNRGLATGDANGKRNDRG